MINERHMIGSKCGCAALPRKAGNIILVELHDHHFPPLLLFINKHSFSFPPSFFFSSSIYAHFCLFEIPVIVLAP